MAPLRHATSSAVRPRPGSPRRSPPLGGASDRP